jgi:hypothetical protein
MSQFEAFKTRIQSVFNNRNISDSLEDVVNEKFEIIDFLRSAHQYRGRSFILHNDDNGYFIILKRNNNRFDLSEEEITHVVRVHNLTNSLCFLPIDGKGTIMPKGSYCDFTFFNNSFLILGEFKTEGLSEHPATIRRNRENATKQLANTIQFFNEALQNNNYEGLYPIAIVIAPPHYPRINPNIQQMRDEFLQLNKVELYEITNEIIHLSENDIKFIT